MTFFFMLLSQNKCRKRSARGGLYFANSLFLLLFHSAITHTTEAPALWLQACIVACLLIASGLVNNLKSISEY
ncbi:11378_t:CDS:2 [Dentiscutata erythropus]|uniref:11378_t:CDS:1 n=1 Tax=Dentiscutata erythropus TaxID=1348616 RepID=A0A9N8W636_9GLOM|nr:11378_t:CDS:2 [Dentiscutata erythropus]